MSRSTDVTALPPELDAVRLLRDTQVAALLGVDRRTVRRLVASGDLPKPIKLAGSTRWRAGQLADYLGKLK